jgi:hypothetical protein
VVDGGGVSDVVDRLQTDRQTNRQANKQTSTGVKGKIERERSLTSVCLPLSHSTLPRTGYSAPLDVAKRSTSAFDPGSCIFEYCIETQMDVRHRMCYMLYTHVRDSAGHDYMISNI